MPSETVSEGIAFVPPFLHHGQCGPVDSSPRFSSPKKDGFSAINRHGSKPVAIPVQTSPPPHNQRLTLFRLNFYAPYFLSADSDFFPFLTKRFSGNRFSLFLVGKHQEKHALQTNSNSSSAGNTRSNPRDNQNTPTAILLSLVQPAKLSRARYIPSIVSGTLLRPFPVKVQIPVIPGAREDRCKLFCPAGTSAKKIPRP